MSWEGQLVYLHMLLGLLYLTKFQTPAICLSSLASPHLLLFQPWTILWEKGGAYLKWKPSLAPIWVISICFLLGHYLCQHKTQLCSVFPEVPPWFPWSLLKSINLFIIFCGVSRLGVREIASNISWPPWHQLEILLSYAHVLWPLILSSLGGEAISHVLH